MSARGDRVIIVAAGRGRRLGGQTEHIPKCMVPIAGRPILEWQLRALHAAGARDIVIVRGYRGDRIASATYPALRFVDNPDWATNNILASLLYAGAEMQDGFSFSYSDIVFSADVASRLAAAAATAGGHADIALVVDRDWQQAYVGRTLHPVDEAELARVIDAADGPRVACVGKRAVPRENAAGEFIGLGWFSAAGAAALRDVWETAVRAGGLDAPFGRAATLRQAYLTDALNALADRGVRIRPVFIDGNWREIDTEQDLAQAEKNVAGWS